MNVHACGSAGGSDDEDPRVARLRRERDEAVAAKNAAASEADAARALANASSALARGASQESDSLASALAFVKSDNEHLRRRLEASEADAARVEEMRGKLEEMRREWQLGERKLEEALHTMRHYEKVINNQEVGRVPFTFYNATPPPPRLQVYQK